MFKIKNLSGVDVYSTENNVAQAKRTITNEGVITQTNIKGISITQRLYEKFIYEVKLVGIKVSEVNTIISQLDNENNHCLVYYSKANFGLEVNKRCEVRIILEDDKNYLGDNLSNINRKTDMTLKLTEIE